MKGKKILHQHAERLPGDVGDVEQQQPVWPRQQADHRVEYDDHAEMHEVDAEGVHSRYEDRYHDQQHSSGFQEAAEQEEQDFDWSPCSIVSAATEELKPLRPR